jgi:preprotein translocase subunit SecB
VSDKETADTEAETPAFRLQRVYVKDISFENPNAPEVFSHSGKQPKVEMSLSLGKRKVNDEHWEVSIKVGAITRDKETEKLLFEIEVEQAGVFYMHNIPEEHIPMLLEVECPTIIFPYIRQIVSQLSVDGGYMPFTLEPVNFRALYDNKLKQAAEQENATVQ